MDKPAKKKRGRPKGTTRLHSFRAHHLLRDLLAQQVAIPDLVEVTGSSLDTIQGRFRDRRADPLWLTSICERFGLKPEDYIIPRGTEEIQLLIEDANRGLAALKTLMRAYAEYIEVRRVGSKGALLKDSVTTSLVRGAGLNISLRRSFTE